MVEPLATGMQAVKKAGITPGDTALVIGAGTIGVLNAMAALAGGCSRVFITDLEPAKLAIAGQYDGVTPINILTEDAKAIIARETQNWGVDIVFEASGSAKAYEGIFEYLRPNGCLVLVGMPTESVPLDVVAAQSKEIRIENVFRYANVFDRAVALMASGKIDVKPLISAKFDFEDSVAAFERAARSEPGDVKIQITLTPA